MAIGRDVSCVHEGRRHLRRRLDHWYRDAALHAEWRWLVRPVPPLSLPESGLPENEDLWYHAHQVGWCICGWAADHGSFSHDEVCREWPTMGLEYVLRATDSLLAPGRPITIEDFKAILTRSDDDVIAEAIVAASRIESDETIDFLRAGESRLQDARLLALAERLDYEMIAALIVTP
jgi:hypothetical protein